MSHSSELHLVTDTDRRGAQTFAAELNLVLYGHLSSLLALTRGGQPQPLPLKTLGPGRLHPRTLLALRRSLRGARVAVAHGSSTLAACAVAGAGVRTPFVYRQISDQSFWAGSRLRRWRVSAYLSRASHVVALWEGAAETLHRDFQVPRSKITVIPNGVPVASFRPADDQQRAAAKAGWGLPADRPVVLSIGALVPEKGVDLALDALAGVPGTTLLVVGDGPEEERLRAHADGLGILDQVVFSPPLADPAAAYDAADVVVLPSRGGDSMPAVLIEAGLKGLPAVAAPVEGIVTIVLDGLTGRLVDPQDPDAVAAAVRDCLIHRADYGARARQHCLDSFAMEVVADQWRRLLQAQQRPSGRGAGAPDAAA